MAEKLLIVDRNPAPSIFGHRETFDERIKEIAEIYRKIYSKVFGTPNYFHDGNEAHPPEWLWASAKENRRNLTYSQLTEDGVLHTEPYKQILDWWPSTARSNYVRKMRIQKHGILKVVCGDTINWNWKEFQEPSGELSTIRIKEVYYEWLPEVYGMPTWELCSLIRKRLWQFKAEYAEKNYADALKRLEEKEKELEPLRKEVAKLRGMLAKEKGR